MSKLPLMQLFEAPSSRVTAATVVAVGFIFWLPYLSSPAGVPLVNPLWGLMFGFVPALVSLTSASSSVIFMTAVLWPLITTSLVGVFLWKTVPKVSRIAHFVVWTSLFAIIPEDLASASPTFRTVGVYTFISM